MRIGYQGSFFKKVSVKTETVLSTCILINTATVFMEQRSFIMNNLECNYVKIWNIHTHTTETSCNHYKTPKAFRSGRKNVVLSIFDEGLQSTFPKPLSVLLFIFKVLLILKKSLLSEIILVMQSIVYTCNPQCFSFGLCASGMTFTKRPESQLVERQIQEQ